MTDLDELMSKAPDELTQVDIDAIIKYHRAQREKREKGEKTEKHTPDLSNLINRITVKSGIVTQPAGSTGFKRRI